MLHITIPSTEQWDEATQEFVYTKERHLQLEHSLVSLSKWESKWGKAFLSSEDKTVEEIIDYVRCMTITQNIDPDTYNYLTVENIRDVDEYINAPMTATHFYDGSSAKKSREVITSELIYYWMIALNVPFECQKWHLNRLLALIRVCNIKNAPPKKRNEMETRSRYAELNEARRKKLNSKG